MSKFTAGPWKLIKVLNEWGEEMFYLEAERPPNGEYDQNIPLASIYKDNAVWLAEGVPDANALLISKAPEMLELLDRYVRGGPNKDDFLSTEDFEKQTMAIIKEIEGE
jgi:hypothetical protein